MSVNNTHDLLITTIDLARACCANGNYLAWLLRHGKALNGSAGIANYLANAALAFQEQAHPQLPVPFDEYDARDNLADILMVSVPLTCEELRAAVAAAIRDAWYWFDSNGQERIA